MSRSNQQQRRLRAQDLHHREASRVCTLIKLIPLQIEFMLIFVLQKKMVQGSNYSRGIGGVASQEGQQGVSVQAYRRRFSHPAQ